jgi:hypothetical protein
MLVCAWYCTGMLSYHNWSVASVKPAIDLGASLEITYSLLEKLISLQLVKKFTAFLWNRKVLYHTSARHLSLS